MRLADQRERASEFHALHHGSGALVLVNVWDAGSARVIEQAGASAIATTSAGMAWSLGYADGEQVPAAEFTAACARVCRVVTLPVSVDIERGFGRTTAELCEIVGALIEMGVVGVNIEDGITAAGQVEPPSVLCERIEALRELSHRMNAGLFINARTDTYLASSGTLVAQYEESVRRAHLYATAGADGIFVPGIDLAHVVSFAKAVSLPLNVYAGAGWASAVYGLRRVGVRRVSLGCGPLQSGFALLQRIAREAFRSGTYNVMSERMLAASEINRMFQCECG